MEQDFHESSDGVRGKKFNENQVSWLEDGQEFHQIIPVAGSSPVTVTVQSFNCHTVQDNGLWEDDEIILTWNDHKVWPRHAKYFELPECLCVRPLFGTV